MFQIAGQFFLVKIRVSLRFLNYIMKKCYQSLINIGKKIKTKEYEKAGSRVMTPFGKPKTTKIESK